MTHIYYNSERRSDNYVETLLGGEDKKRVRGRETKYGMYYIKNKIKSQLKHLKILIVSYFVIKSEPRELSRTN